MGTGINKEKIEKIKIKNIKLKLYNKNRDQIFTEEVDSSNNNNNLILNFRAAYTPEKVKDFEEEENNAIEFKQIKRSDYPMRSEEKEGFVKKLEELEETKEINDILFRKHRSFELDSTFFLPKKIIKDDDNYSVTLTTTECTHKLLEANSVKELIFDNSDYIDIGQAIYFNDKKNKIMNDKTYYTESNRIRNGYYTKLIIKEIWKPLTKEKKSNTIFIFDWDDTLMCTTYLIPIINSNNQKINNQIIQKKLKNLDEIDSNLLLLSLDRGMVFIITNASPGWVEYSANNFLPSTAKVLNKINVISAKGLYSKKFPGDPKQWKINAFKYIIKKFNINTKKISNIICLGDSYIDLEAIENFKYCFSNAFVKVIKFVESPHLVMLEKQIWIVQSQLDYILQKDKNFRMRVSKNKND
jgi:hypothetical protein